MDWQQAPYGKVKMVRCSQGRVWNVVVDLREDLSTFGQWQAFRLDIKPSARIFKQTLFYMDCTPPQR